MREARPKDTGYHKKRRIMEQEDDLPIGHKRWTSLYINRSIIIRAEEKFLYQRSELPLLL